MVYLLILTCAFWFVITLAALSTLWAVKPLPSRHILKDFSENRPRVSVVMAARDEQDHIESSLRSILAQDDLELQIVAVNDRSADTTGNILDRIASEDERLTVVNLTELPSGWLGKCHACYQGAKQATGDWLLFTDADTMLATRDVLLRSIATLERDGADHMALWPTVQCRGPLARGSILAWQASLSAYAPPILINNDIGQRAIGIGAYNLVRREAYYAIGGHEPLRMEVVDDIKLAVLLRRAGFRQRIYRGINEVNTSWGGSTREMIQILEKNWFAAVGFNLFLAISVLLLLASTWCIGITGPMWNANYWGWLALGSVLSIILPSLADARSNGWPLYSALFAPLGNVVLVIAAINSVQRTLRQGGIRWRDTFYPLDELRRGRVK